MLRAVITIHSASYTLTDGRIRPITLAVVSRQRQRPDGGWRNTRQRIIDAGDSTQTAAHRVALAFVPGQAPVKREIEHGSLGTFGFTDEDRDAMLAKVRALPRVSVGNSVHVDPVQFTP